MKYNISHIISTEDEMELLDVLSSIEKAGVPTEELYEDCTATICATEALMYSHLVSCKNNIAEEGFIDDAISFIKRLIASIVDSVRKFFTWLVDNITKFINKILGKDIDIPKGTTQEQVNTACISVKGRFLETSGRVTFIDVKKIDRDEYADLVNKAIDEINNNIDKICDGTPIDKTGYTQSYGQDSTTYVPKLEELLDKYDPDTADKGNIFNVNEFINTVKESMLKGKGIGSKDSIVSKIKEDMDASIRRFNKIKKTNDDCCRKIVKRIDDISNDTKLSTSDKNSAIGDLNRQIFAMNRFLNSEYDMCKRTVVSDKLKITIVNEICKKIIEDNKK